MIECNEFRRGSAIAAPAFLFYLTAALLALNGVAHLLGRQWIWGAADLFFAALAWLNTAWTKRTPIIRVGGEEITVLRHQFARPKRIRVSEIRSVDESRPSVARLALEGGREVVIPLHWIEWDDRSRFLSFLRSVAGDTCGGIHRGLAPPRLSAKGHLR